MVPQDTSNVVIKQCSFAFSGGRITSMHTKVHIWVETCWYQNVNCYGIIGETLLLT